MCRSLISLTLPRKKSSLKSVTKAMLNMVQRNLLPVMVLSMVALFFQLHSVQAQRGYYANSVQARRYADTQRYYANAQSYVLSAMMEDTVPDMQPSPNPMFQEFVEAAQTEVVDRRIITLDDFRDGYVVEWTFLAPDAGHVSMNMKDELGRDIILHVDARYKWHASNEDLVLNTFHGSWGPEQRPDGFDFTPGILVKMRVEAGPNSFRIFSNSHQIADYKYRLPVTSVKMVELIFEDQNSTEKAKLKSISVFFAPLEL